MTEKLLAFILLISLCYIGCTDDDIGHLETDSIIGTWRQFQTAYSPGSGVIVDDVVNGPILSLRIDGQFSLSSSLELTGTWEQINDNEIMLDFEVDEWDITYEYTVDENILRLVPLDPGCVEVCFTKWRLLE